MFAREEAKKILDGSKASPFPSMESKLFFTLSYYTGLSVETVRELKWGNLHLDKSMIRTVEVDEEGDEEVERIFDETLISWFAALQGSLDGINSEEYIFAESDGEPLSMDTIQKNFEITMEASGIDFQKRKLTPNSFRRTFNFWYA